MKLAKDALRLKKKLDTKKRKQSKRLKAASGRKRNAEEIKMKTGSKNKRQLKQVLKSFDNMPLEEGQKEAQLEPKIPIYYEFEEASLAARYGDYPASLNQHKTAKVMVSTIDLVLGIYKKTDC